KSEDLNGAHFKVTCYFDRAMRLAPDDPTVRKLYAQHLWMTGHRKEAVEQIEEAERLGAQDANTLYNIGIMKFELGDRTAARNYAMRAYELGFPLPGLRDKLKKFGMWDAK
ncbi:MAG: hypothetical protein KC592_20010, partial [Nitrospira sp.]|nr:hypothetical protein [Nitrospira sp.]